MRLSKKFVRRKVLITKEDQCDLCDGPIGCRHRAIAPGLGLVEAFRVRDDAVSVHGRIHSVPKTSPKPGAGAATQGTHSR